MTPSHPFPIQGLHSLHGLIPLSTNSSSRLLNLLAGIKQFALVVEVLMADSLTITFRHILYGSSPLT